jgi:predicted RNA-binding protein
MAYYLDMFSPETYEAFSKTDKTITGFRRRQSTQAKRIKPGDKLVCYMTKLSRWIGVLEVTSGSFTDTTPIFYSENDPFVVRFQVRPVVWLPKEQAIPIREEKVWKRLTFTKGHEKQGSAWTGILRASLNHLEDQDGLFLEELLLSQSVSGELYPVDEREYRKWFSHPVKGPEGVVSVQVPENGPPEDEEVHEEITIRESIKVQALIASIGEKMGFKIWLPRNDRSRILMEWVPGDKVLLDSLPLNYDEATIRTIEQIDVIWLKNRSIKRAFEVEHTTSIYSGILRMADLLALQPNMDIKLHLVAPDSRRDKVFEELKRPVFMLLEKGPLAKSCTFIPYNSLYDLSNLPHLAHVSDSVLEEYEEEAE